MYFDGLFPWRINYKVNVELCITAHAGKPKTWEAEAEIQGLDM